MSKRILIVEDDGILCDELAEILRDEGYEASSAPDGLAAQQRAATGGFDLFILDFKMTGMDGLELLKVLKERHGRSKFFLISGRPFIEKTVKERKLDHAVDELFAKPLDIDELLAKIKKHL